MGKTGGNLFWKAPDRTGLHDDLFIFQFDHIQKGTGASNCIEPFHARNFWN
jgi:hypothetical protein